MTILDADKVETLRSRYLDGTTMHDTALEVGVSLSSVQRYFNAFYAKGLQRPPRSRRYSAHGWPQPYYGPDMIGIAIGEPLRREGPGWIG